MWREALNFVQFRISFFVLFYVAARLHTCRCASDALSAVHRFARFISARKPSRHLSTKAKPPPLPQQQPPCYTACMCCCPPRTYHTSNPRCCFAVLRRLGGGGLAAAVLRRQAGPSNAVFFLVYDALKALGAAALLGDLSGGAAPGGGGGSSSLLPTALHLGASSIATVPANLVRTPAEVVKQRLQVWLSVRPFACAYWPFVVYRRSRSLAALVRREGGRLQVFGGVSCCCSVVFVCRRRRRIGSGSGFCGAGESSGLLSLRRFGPHQPQVVLSVTSCPAHITNYLHHRDQPTLPPHPDPVFASLRSARRAETLCRRCCPSLGPRGPRGFSSGERSS